MARDEGHDASNLGDLADDGTPVDLAAVRRDDALIESISNGGPVATDSTEQYELALILSQWRDDVVATPMPEGPLLDDVIAAITATPSGFSDRQRSRSRSRLRVVRPIAAAAAVAAVVFGGATAMAYDAQPGDALWGVKQVVFADEANSDSCEDRHDFRAGKGRAAVGCRRHSCGKDGAGQRSSPCRCGQGLAGQDRPRRALGQVDDAGPGDHVTRSAAVDEWSASSPRLPRLDHGDSGDPPSIRLNPQLTWGCDHVRPTPRSWNAAAGAWSKRRRRRHRPTSSPTATTTTTTTTTTTMTPLAPASSPSGDFIFTAALRPALIGTVPI